jgi:hypothetical protein
MPAIALWLVVGLAPCSMAQNPPDSFRGIKWDSPLPSRRELLRTALKGCGTIVEQNNFTDTPPCSHMHGDTDDMDMYTQRQNLPPFFGVQVSEQLLTWSYRKFWSGEVFIHGYKETDLTNLRVVLTREYGSPTFDEYRRTEWSWPRANLKIRLSFDPVPKPSIGSSAPPRTSLSVRFMRTD